MSVAIQSNVRAEETKAKHDADFEVGVISEDPDSVRKACATSASTVTVSD